MMHLCMYDVHLTPSFHPLSLVLPYKISMAYYSPFVSHTEWQPASRSLRLCEHHNQHLYPLHVDHRRSDSPAGLWQPVDWCSGLHEHYRGSISHQCKTMPTFSFLLDTYTPPNKGALSLYLQHSKWFYFGCRVIEGNR